MARGEIMLGLNSSEGVLPTMPNSVGENRTKRKFAAGELVLCVGVNQMRAPNVAMMAAACGFGAIRIDLEHNLTSLETAAALAARHSGSVPRSLE